VYFEGTVVKQVMKHLARQKNIPKACLFTLPLVKPDGTTTYCYTQEQVTAMIEHCLADRELPWLAQIIATLAQTGMRIGEAINLKWSDIDLDLDDPMIHLKDERWKKHKSGRKNARKLKSGRDRLIPIRPLLHETLSGMSHHRDGYVFHGPRGGRLNPSVVLNTLKRDVIAPLKDQFPSEEDENGFANGTVHSFRHFFCSMCAAHGVSETLLKGWLGHKSSKMVAHYFHLHNRLSHKAIADVEFFTEPAVDGAGGSN
jgi:integrase